MATNTGQYIKWLGVSMYGTPSQQSNSSMMSTWNQSTSWLLSSIRNTQAMKEQEKQRIETAQSTQRTNDTVSLYGQSLMSTSEPLKKQYSVSSRGSELASMIVEMGKEKGVTYTWNDKEVIDSYLKQNPWQSKALYDFTHWNQKSEDFALKMWWIDETALQKAADFTVWVAQSPWKWWYNLMWKWIDKIAKWGAEQLQGSDLHKWVQEKAIDLFGEDEVRAYQQQTQKQIEDGTIFDGRTQTDIRTPLLGEVRANSKYTKAWETVWDMATWIAMTAPIAWAVAPAWASSTALWKTILWWMTWILDSALMAAGSEWRNATPWELAMWWVLGGGLGGSSWIFSKYIKNLSKPAQDKIKQEAASLIEKSIKPSIKGKKSFGQYDKFVDDTLDVTNFFWKNKNLIKYTNANGEEVVWKLPTTLKETNEAFSNMKKTLYDAYNEIAMEAWEAWARVNLRNVLDELDNIGGDVAQNIANPSTQNTIQKYKQAILNSVDEAWTISIEDAQKLTQEFNKQLEAFFRNPTMNDVSSNSIIAKINKGLRESINTSLDDVLDAWISNGWANSKYYQDLKSMYGKIKSVEGEVSRAALNNAKKNLKGGTDSVIDALAWWDITSALLSLDPAQAAKWVTMNIIKNYYKKLNDPNRYIKKLFELSDSKIDDVVNKVDDAFL